jgi:hypothetical protein
MIGCHRLSSLCCFLALTTHTGKNACATELILTAPAEVIADIEMSSPGSDWSAPGREAALATLTLAGKPAQHIMLWAGEERHTYSAFLGALDAGRYDLSIDRHPQYSAPGSHVAIHSTRFRQLPRTDPHWAELAHAPILYARADTIGQFTDIPFFAYCERLQRGGPPLHQKKILIYKQKFCT